MFKLLNTKYDIRSQICDVWEREGDHSKRAINLSNYREPRRYPCLGAVALTYSYGGNPQHMHIYCLKNEAKRLIYPQTNKDRGGSSLRFIEDHDKLWEIINADFRASGMTDNQTQSRIFDDIHRLISYNKSFPVLYTYLNTTISRNSKLFRPIVLPLYMAKKLVYYKSETKMSKMVISPSVLARPMYALQRGSRDRDRARMDRNRASMPVRIDINLLAETHDIIRFVHNKEIEFLQREQLELDKMNRELSIDLEDIAVAHRSRYLDRNIVVFNSWRTSERVMHARQYPQEVVLDTRNQKLLRDIRSNNA